MNRREFLQYVAVLAASAAAPSCATPAIRARRAPLAMSDVAATLCLKNAAIVDVERAALRPERTLLIRGGRIAALIHDDARETIAADHTLDLGGAYVMPGLINAHCHMSAPGAAAVNPRMMLLYREQLERGAATCIRHGVTTVRDMRAMGAMLDELRATIADEGIPAPRIVANDALEVSGGYGMNMGFFAKNVHVRAADTPEQGREGVRRALDRGADFIKLFQQPHEVLLPGDPLPVMDAPTVAAIVDEAAKRGRVVGMHSSEATGFMKGLRAGVRSLEHLPRDRVLTDDEIAELKRSGTAVVPTLSVAFALSFHMPGDENWDKGMMPAWAARRPEVLAALIGEFVDPPLVEGSVAFVRRLSSPTFYAKKRRLPWPLPTAFTAMATRGITNLKAMHAAGVPMGCGNDGGVPLVFPGAIFFEGALLEEAGFTAAEALKMATFENARILQRDGEIGTVDKGKIADLVVLKDNPLESTRAWIEPAMVLQDGRVAYPA